MSNEVLVSIIGFISALLVALLSVALSYNKTKAETDKLHQETIQLKLENELAKRKLNELAESTNKLAESTKKFAQVTSYKDYKKAFQELEEHIRCYLDKCKADNITAPTIDLKLIAVAITFSWDNFVLTVIPDLLNDYPNLILNLDILFVSHEHLKAQKIGMGDIDWVKKSKERVVEVKDFYNRYRKQYEKRFNFRAKVYSNIPHWHGWLFNEDHLFLGRTSWEIYEKNLPILKVGQNKYRHFSDPSENSEAAERIELFKNWHKYYFDFASEWVAGNTPKARPN